MKSLLIAASFVISLMAATSSVQAAERHRTLYPNIPWSNQNQPCYDEAAAYHKVDPWLLYAIAKVESSHNPTAINRANRNGTYDRGLMQINSIHYGTLKKHGIDASALDNACASTYIGAWVLADKMRVYGNSWKAIASYNVGSVNNEARYRVGLNYAKKVYKAYDDLKRQHGRR